MKLSMALDGKLKVAAGCAGYSCGWFSRVTRFRSRTTVVQQVQHYVEARLTTELGLQLLLLATARASDDTSPRKSREFGLEAV